MQIFCNGFVSHEDSFKDIATGKLEDVGSMLNITLKNTITGRTGFCCISVNRQELPQKLLAIMAVRLLEFPGKAHLFP